jgi:hypothetical protein
LVVDAPDVVRLFMHEDSRAWIRWWIEPGQSLGRKVAFELNVDDYVPAFVTRVLELQSSVSRT